MLLNAPLANLNMTMHLTRWVHKQWQKRGCVARLLYPLSLITAQIVKHRQKKRIKPAPLNLPPILIVGNILVGGAGKTPVVIALCQAFKRRGLHPGVISRGYGAQIGTEAIAGYGPFTPQQVGDEPSLIAAQAQVPIGVHPDRFLALQSLLARAPQTNVIIADDGLQHYGLPRDVEIIVQDERGIGNGWLLPAGPLREGPQRLETVDWVIQHGHKTMEHSIQMHLQPIAMEHLASGQKQPLNEWLIAHPSACQAFAAIGQPQRFFTMLKALGITLTKTMALADHATLTATELKEFDNRPILTTTKDAIKLAHSPYRTDPRFWVVHVEAQFTPSDWIERLINQLQQFQPVSDHVKNNS